MATLVFAPIEQSTQEVKRIWQFDFTPDMPTGVTLVSATAVHVPPSGAPLTPVVGTIVAGVVPVALGKLRVTGLHYLDCLATYSNPDAEVSHIRLAIPCNY